MPEETGIVIEARKNTAVIRLNKSEACNNCSASCLVDQTDKFVTMEAQDPLGVEKGDQVIVKINTSVTKLSFIVFGLPLILLFLGIGLGHLIGSILLRSYCLDCLRFGFGGGFFLLSFLFLIKLDRKLACSRPAYIKEVTGRS